MSILRDLLLITNVTNIPFKPLQLAVFGGREGTGVQDGGRCCCWKIPSGTTWATFEGWGAGGDGPGACCCQGQYRSGGTGQYAKRTLTVSPTNEYFIICAAGSGCCAQSCCGQCGFPTFVLCCNGTQTMCAPGGYGGCGVCHHMGGLACTGICQSGQGGGNRGCQGQGDIYFGSLSEPDKESNFCVNQHWHYQPMTLKYGPNFRRSFDPCAMQMTRMGCDYWGSQVQSWPGGPGAGAQACGGPCCWGYFGTGGLVLITYG